MKFISYGKKMFITDLILTSIWAFFFRQYSGIGLLFLIPIRLVLCFEMKRKSPWPLISAIGFLLSFSSVNYLSKPFENMFYIFFYYIGQSKQMVELFSNQQECEIEPLVGLITALWFIWLAILPVIVGIRLKNIKRIQWQRKWIWIYILSITGLCVWITLKEGNIGIILEGYLIAFLPIIYWSIYDRKGRSAVQLILADRSIMWYTLYSVLMLSAITLGLNEIPYLRFAAILIQPPFLYIMIVKSMRLGTILTRCCIALSIAGLCYWLSFHSTQLITITLLATGVLLILYVGFTMIFITRKWTGAIILIFLLPVVVIPLILGLNPYVATDANELLLYTVNRSVRKGVYIVGKDYETGINNKIYNRARKYGIRDRYGLILPIEYGMLSPIDTRGRYILTNSAIRYEGNSNQPFGIFDLNNRTFIINPDYGEVSRIVKIDEKSFKLLNSKGRYFATLYLPGEYRGAYYADAHVEPHFADGEITVNEFIGRYYNPNELYESAYCRGGSMNDRTALRFLVYIAEFGGDSPSPANDLNFARAFRKIIDEDSYYKGNIDKVFDDVARIRKSMEPDPEGIMESYPNLLMLISRIKTTLDYDVLMSHMPYNECINKEYVEWHNLMEAMTNYIDYIYSFEPYHSNPEKKYIQIISWFSQRQESLMNEKDILSGKLVCSPDLTKNDSLKSAHDILDFFLNFRSSDPYYYHPMWNEIRATFEDWKLAREQISEQLESNQSLSYQEYTNEVVNNVFSLIEGLDFPGFIPAL